MSETVTIQWIDAGIESVQESNSKYPDGVDVDASNGSSLYCVVELPYPAKRCGFYLITCLTCDQRVLINTKGTADDPRRVKMPCALGRMKMGEA